MRTLGQIRSDSRKKKRSTSFKWSQKRRLNPISSSDFQEGSYVFTEDMFALAQLTKFLATGPEDTLKTVTDLLHDLQKEHLDEFKAAL